MFGGIEAFNVLTPSVILCRNEELAVSLSVERKKLQCYARWSRTATSPESSQPILRLGSPSPILGCFYLHLLVQCILWPNKWGRFEVILGGHPMVFSRGAFLFLFQSLSASYGPTVELAMSCRHVKHRLLWRPVLLFQPVFLDSFACSAVLSVWFTSECSDRQKSLNLRLYRRVVVDLRDCPGALWLCIVCARV